MSGRVVTYGSFDLFHVGHLELLRRAYLEGAGRPLHVYVSSDGFHYIKKGNKPIIDVAERSHILEGCKYVSEVHFEFSWEQKENDLEDDDILVMGDDWAGKFDDLPCTVVYLPRTPGISTTEIKERIRNG
jgi:glycerol-3-phosphate cytidylyltransferase